MLSVIQLPGSNDDRDMRFAMKTVLGCDTRLVWHKEAELPPGTQGVLIPGGFSYGDYLRAGAMAAASPVMAAVKRFAEAGGPVLGVCNGFQILCEAGLLPGVLIRNHHLHFVCDFADAQTLDALEAGGQVLLRYCDAQGRVGPECNPNGSLREIAGLSNPRGNVFGMMPHPEHAVEAAIGGTDGLAILGSLADAVRSVGRNGEAR